MRRLLTTQEVLMPDHSPAKAVSEPTQAVPSTGALKHLRAAALVAALVPLAQVVVAPVPVFAQDCGGSGAPCPVPDGGSTVVMATTAAAFIGYQLRKKKK
jgi:hypothetical protein